MTEPRRFIVSALFAWSLTIAVGVMAVAGVIAAFLSSASLDHNMLRLLCVLSFAAMAGLALANANCAAAAAQHCVSRGAPFWTATGPALLNAFIFSAASVIGVHLGWEILKVGAQPGIGLPSTIVVDVGAFLVAFAKVTQAWVVETRRSLDAAQIETADAAEREVLSASRTAQRSTTSNTQPTRPVNAPNRPIVSEVDRPIRAVSQIGQSAACVAAISTLAAGASVDRPLEAARTQSASLKPFSHSEQTWASREAHAASLLSMGMSQRSVVRDTGLTRYRVGKIAERTPMGAG